jgi:hypothetical protein
MTPTYTGEIEPWGARYKLLAFIPFVWIDGEYRVRGGSNVNDSTNADLGDTGFEATIGWQEKSIIGVDGLNFDYATGLLVVAPTGKYERNEVLNAGKNRWMIQPNFSYTLFHEATGIEVSQRLMYGFNTRNDKTSYRSGQELHFDYAVGKRFDFGLTAGLFGFWYRQTTADGGRGATTGNLKGKAWGIGPMLQYSGEVLGVPVSSTVRYQKVFQHMNRTIDLPLDEQLKFSVGYAKRGESKWGHAISASVLWLGDGEVDQTAQGARFKGEFDSNWLFIIGANLQYRF